MTSYLIEFRFSGYAKEAIKELKESISRNFHVTKKKIVPHITLVGPVSTYDEKRLVREITEIGRKYDLIKLTLDGFGRFENRVILVKIKPSEELENLRLDMVERLEEFCNLSEHDYDRKFAFHATLVLNDIQRKFDKIAEYLQTWKIPDMEQYLIRITIIKDHKILVEYDLMQEKTLNRKDALDGKTFQKSIKILNKKRKPAEIKFEDVTGKKIHVYSDVHLVQQGI